MREGVHFVDVSDVEKSYFITGFTSKSRLVALPKLTRVSL